MTRTNLKRKLSDVPHSKERRCVKVPNLGKVSKNLSHLCSNDSPRPRAPKHCKTPQASRSGLKDRSYSKTITTVTCCLHSPCPWEIFHISQSKRSSGFIIHILVPSCEKTCFLKPCEWACFPDTKAYNPTA